MVNDLRKAEKLLQTKDARQNIHSEIANELLLEMKVVLALVLAKYYICSYYKYRPPLLI